jgi:pSer/pThr/pTyr-binding forkhead associated (FHA) protein
VSKFHGWFEVDEMGGLHVADAGSKNSTRVNGKQLNPRELTRVGPGDSIRFGSVEALLCAPQTLFAALR